MRFTVRLPLFLNKLTGLARITVEAHNLPAVWPAVAKLFPGASEYLLTPAGELQSRFKIFIHNCPVNQSRPAQRPAGRPPAEPARFRPDILNSDLTVSLVPECRGAEEAGSPAAKTGPQTVKEPLAPQRALPALEPEETVRYSRHLLMPEVGPKGQKRLKAARVLIAGTGGLGSPLALYLAAAGVGTIGLIDHDLVELSNLQRQIVHSQDSIGRPKVLSARERLLTLNPKINVQAYDRKLSSENALDIFKDYDLICDGTDNFPARYLINDAAAFLGLPMVYGSVYRFEGQAAVFWAKHGPCYRCLYPEPPAPGTAPSCGEAGVVGVLPGIIGSIQAAEAIKLIVGRAKTLLGRLLLVDAWLMEFTEMGLEKNPDCPLCGLNPAIDRLIDYEHFCGLDLPPELAAPSIEALELIERLKSGPPVQLLDIREEYEDCPGLFPQTITVSFRDLAENISKLQAGTDTVVMCQAGTRSLFAIRSLKKAGFTGTLYNLKDGTAALVRAAEAAPELINSLTGA
ncbi:MAG: molybdopterin-synthase adenylyltransferase MoeB [Deltaproteobacteria bacterium]|nr:molybdopterin-synthase adenylyltransferase MoeB [Deltaproteobacteria bacterium]